jgi:light-independent protochlorophyllide reductase subunit B
MERHIAKRLGVPCAVISAPVHVQDFPARYSPQMGFEGANVMFDTWVHPLMMGLEEHLLHMFRGDFEFHDGAAPSHLGSARRAPAAGEACRPSRGGRSRARGAPASAIAAGVEATARPAAPTRLGPDAEKELRRSRSSCAARPAATPKVCRRNGLTRITVETLYDAKAHFSR